MTLTPLDRAHAAAEAPSAPPDARARFYALMLESALFCPVGDTAADAAEDAALKPLVFALENGPVALAFDDDARMAAFFDAPTEYVTLQGRALAAALAAAGLGLGLNLGDAPSATLLDAATVAWLAAEMGGGVEAAALDGALTLGPPRGAEPGLCAALTERLSAFPGMVAEAWLVRLGADAAAARLTLLFQPTAAFVRGAEALSGALGRAAQPYAPSGEEVVIGALTPEHPLLRPARAQGLRLWPAPEAPETPAPKTPAPPRLR